MKLLFAIIIAVILSGSSVLSQTCGKSAPDDILSQYSENDVLTNIFSSPSNYLTVYMDVSFSQYCSSTIELLSIYGNNNFYGHLVSMFELTFVCSTKKFLLNSDSDSSKPLNEDPSPSDIHSISVSINLQTGEWRIGLFNDRDMITKSGTDYTLTRFTFDSSTELHLCDTYYCFYRDLTYVNTFVTNAELLVRSDKSKLIGSYQFQEGVGVLSKNLLSNSTANVALPSAVFGTQTANYTDSPQWLTSGPGVAFTSTNQTIAISSIPCPQIGRHRGFATGLSVWLRINDVPTSEQTIFRYLTSMKAEQASINLGSDATIKVALQNAFRTSTSALPINKWTQLTVLLNLPVFDGYNSTFVGNCFISIYIGTENQTAVPSSCILEGYEPSASLIIGGFVGQMQDLLIFGTPAYYITTSTCSSAISMSLGNSYPEVGLLRSACDDRMLVGRSSSCYNCSDVITSCNDDLSALTCSQGYFINGSICSKCDDGRYSKTRDASECSGACPDNCLTCFDSSGCQVCEPGYSLQGGQCVQCSPGTYALSGSSGACTETCPSNCSTCTSQSSCQSCVTGFGLQDNQCITCPNGTYATSTSCSTCPSSCATCTNQTYCDSCNAGFGLASNQCIVCPEGTYATPTSCVVKESKSGIGSVVVGLILFLVVLALVFFGYRYIQRRRVKSAEGSQEPKAELALAFVQNPSANTTQSSQIQL